MSDQAARHTPWAQPVPGRPWAEPDLPDPAKVPVAVPVAWLGRTSTADSRDPTLSLPRQLRTDSIAERLNADPAANPAPKPTRAGAALGCWSGGAVREIVRDPKYTGYQVWKRRSTKRGGKNADPAEWVWSPQPTHELLVTKEFFDTVAKILGARRGSRGGSESPSAAGPWTVSARSHRT